MNSTVRKYFCPLESPTEKEDKQCEKLCFILSLLILPSVVKTSSSLQPMSSLNGALLRHGVYNRYHTMLWYPTRLS